MNSRNAWPNELRAGVNTGEVPQRDGAAPAPHVGWPGLRNSQATVTTRISVAATRRRKILLGAAEATDEVNEVPRIGVRDLSFQALHVVLGRRAVLDHPEDLAFARAERAAGRIEGGNNV